MRPVHEVHDSVMRKSKKMGVPEFDRLFAEVTSYQSYHHYLMGCRRL